MSEKVFESSDVLEKSVYATKETMDVRALANDETLSVAVAASLTHFKTGLLFLVSLYLTLLFGCLEH